MEQRKIKFRAWDEEFGEMIYPFAGSYNSESNTSQPATTIVPDATDSENYTWIIYWDGASDKKEVRLCKGLKTMQFTGLRDKNGKDIYEGDIIKWATEKGGVWDKPQKDIVKFNNGCFVALLALREMAYIEVIGNCYEHPSLISQQLT